MSSMIHFMLSGKMTSGELVKDNDKTVLVKVKKKGKDNIIKRHKIKNHVIHNMYT